jgi:hypothetical protein
MRQPPFFTLSAVCRPHQINKNISGLTGEKGYHPPQAVPLPPTPRSGVEEGPRAIMFRIAQFI